MFHTTFQSPSQGVNFREILAGDEMVTKVIQKQGKVLQLKWLQELWWDDLDEAPQAWVGRQLAGAGPGGQVQPGPGATSPLSSDKIGF